MLQKARMCLQRAIALSQDNALLRRDLGLLYYSRAKYVHISTLFFSSFLCSPFFILVSPVRAYEQIAYCLSSFLYILCSFLFAWVLASSVSFVCSHSCATTLFYLLLLARKMRVLANDSRTYFKYSPPSCLSTDMHLAQRSQPMSGSSFGKRRWPSSALAVRCSLPSGTAPTWPPRPWRSCHTQIAR